MHTDVPSDMPDEHRALAEELVKLRREHQALVAASDALVASTRRLEEVSCTRIRQLESEVEAAKEAVLGAVVAGFAMGREKAAEVLDAMSDKCIYAGNREKIPEYDAIARTIRAIPFKTPDEE